MWRRYSLSQAALVSILAALWGLGGLNEQHAIVVADIMIIKQVLGILSTRNEQARKFLFVVERLMPDSSLENEDLSYNFDGADFDDMVLNTSSDTSFPQADEWARFFLPVPS